MQLQRLLKNEKCFRSTQCPIKEALAVPRRVVVRAKSRRAAATKSRKQPSSRTGRGFSQQQLDELEEELETGLPTSDWPTREEYKVYYKPEYLPPRMQGFVHLAELPGKCWCTSAWFLAVNYFYACSCDQIHFLQAPAASLCCLFLHDRPMHNLHCKWAFAHKAALHGNM